MQCKFFIEECRRRLHLVVKSIWGTTCFILLYSLIVCSSLFLYSMRNLSIPLHLEFHTPLLHPLIFVPLRVHRYPRPFTPQPTSLRHALFQPHHFTGPLYLPTPPFHRGYGKVLQNLGVDTDFKLPRRRNDVSGRGRWRVMVPIEDRSWRGCLRRGRVVRVRD